MNIVTIKAKAQLAAMKIWKGKNFAVDAMTIVIEQAFINPASEANKDLIEALQALKNYNDVTSTCIIPLSDKMPLVSKCIYDASKILDKYPNLI